MFFTPSLGEYSTIGANPKDHIVRHLIDYASVRDARFQDAMSQIRTLTLASETHRRAEGMIR